jgi:hypothetical protein
MTCPPDTGNPALQKGKRAPRFARFFARDSRNGPRMDVPSSLALRVNSEEEGKLCATNDW